MNFKTMQFLIVPQAVNVFIKKHYVYLCLFILSLLDYGEAAIGYAYPSMSTTPSAFIPASNSQFEIIIQTPDMNESYVSLAQEVIRTPFDTLLKMPVELLPVHYWVPKRRGLMYWPTRSIGFELSQSFSEKEQQLVRDALQELSVITDKCVQFYERTWRDRDYLLFKRSRYCDSRIGYTGGRHAVKLSPNCLIDNEPGFVQHEVMHALGFFHEHSRQDRDNWVDINWSNIKEGQVKEFSKLKFRTFDLPYDYLSVMHYASDAYAINETDATIKPTNSAVTISGIGQRKSLSPTDILRVKKAYRCDDDSQDSSDKLERQGKQVDSDVADTQEDVD